MLLIGILIASILVGYLRGGRLMRYLEHPLHWLGLPIAAFALEAALPLWQRLPLPDTLWLGLIVIGQYTLLLLFCWRNRDHGAGMLLITVGMVCNLASMCANGFRMPVLPLVYDYPVFASFLESLLAGHLPEYVLVGYDAPLWFLGDAIPLLYVFPGLASIGDLILGVGVFLLIQREMGAGAHKK